MKRFLIAASAVAVLVLAAASPAFAHPHTDPNYAPTGSQIDLTVNLSHGCGDSGTNQIDIELPADLEFVAFVDAPEGFEGAQDGNVLSWTGGVIPHDTTAGPTFTVDVVGADGTTVWIPVVQMCENGDGYSWVQVPAEGQTDEDLQTPAAMFTISTEAPPEEADHEMTDEEMADTASDDEASAGDSDSDSDSDSDDGGNSGLVTGVIAGVVVLLALGGGYGFARSRRDGGSEA